MKAIVQRSSLLAALSSLHRVIERRNTIPILGNVLLNARGNGLVITATDLDVEMTTVIDVDVDRAGSTTVTAETLFDISKKLKDGSEVMLDLKNENEMTVRSGRSRFDLHILPAIDYPSITVGEFSHALELPAPTLLAALEQVAFAISTEETRYYLNGVFFHTLVAGEANVFRLVATDGHRLSKTDLALESVSLKRIDTSPDDAWSTFPGSIVPRKTVGLMTDLIKAEKGHVTLEFSGTKVRLTVGSTVLTSKLIDGIFPDYARVIPQGNDKAATIKRLDLAASVDRVTTVSNTNGRAVRLKFGDGSLGLSCVNADVGVAEDAIDIDFNDPEMTIGFNGRYLQDVLGKCRGESVTIRMSDAGSPAIFTGQDDPRSLIVLMPMRV